MAQVATNSQLSWEQQKKGSYQRGYYRQPMTIEKPFSPTETESGNTSSLKSQVLKSLKTSKEYRHSFVEEKIQSGLAAQIVAIRELRRLDPRKFAEALGKKVSWVYRLEDPNQSPPTIPSLLEVARAFDVDLEVRFRAFSGLLDEVGRLSPDSLKVLSFKEELPELERIASDADDLAAILRYRNATERLAAGFKINSNTAASAAQRTGGDPFAGYCRSILSLGRSVSFAGGSDIISRFSLRDPISIGTTRKPPGIETEPSQDRFGATGSEPGVIPTGNYRSPKVIQIRDKHTDSKPSSGGAKSQRRAS
jgi:transcriptional regulator with XRE-family HTH domain